MVQLFNLVLVALWLPQVLEQIFNWEYWIQTKEYRFDRFQVLLFSREGTKSLGLYMLASKLMLGVLILLFNLPNFLFIIIFFILDITLVRKLFAKQIRKPVLTQRAQRILFVSLLVILSVMVYFLFTFNIWVLLIGEIMALIGLFIGVTWTIIFVNSAKIKDVIEAKKIIKQVKPVAIGITGSYGKTTTKEFLAHILSYQDKTEMSIKNENTEFGIARMIINKLKIGIKYLVCEMGAYKKGEIKAICDIVQPEIGIITGIEPQHLAIFGSFENLKDAKFELIDALPNRGIAIFNYTNSECRLLAERAHKLNKKLKVYGYTIGQSIGIKADMIAQIDLVNIDNIDFSIQIEKKLIHLSAPISGAHLLENLTGAILTARILGVNWDVIKKACLTISTPDGTMKVEKLSQGALLINDSYNTTPKSFEVALEFLKDIKNRHKIIITPGIIELGGYSKRIHESLAKKIQNIVDVTLVTNLDNFHYLKGGFETKDKIMLISTKEDIQSHIEKVIQNKGAILLEGRSPSWLMKYLESYK